MIELATFRLASGAGEAAFLAADARYQTGVAYQQPGIVRRTTARGADGGWLVVTIWESADAADAAPPFTDPTIDPASVVVARYDDIGG